MTRTGSLAAWTLVLLLLALARADRPHACGPFLADPVSINPVFPDEAFVRGQVGVVLPTYARRYLVRAYRHLNGLPVAIEPAPSEPSPPPGPSAEEGAASWLNAIRTYQPARPASLPVSPWRALPDYASYLNCLHDAFATATRTLDQRAAAFGRTSPVVADWIAAQEAVFANCDGAPGDAPVLPPAAPAGAPGIVTADRAYQTAAAYFYAQRFDEAGARFDAIAADATSPWRALAALAAARTFIRRATLAPESDRSDGPLVEAERRLRAIAADPRLVPVHDSARRLIGFVVSRLRASERIAELGARLAAIGLTREEDLADYTTLLDQLIGDTVQFRYDSVGKRDVMIRDELTDWILAMQGSGEDAAERAVTRWQAAPASPHWLVAALWKVRRDHPMAGRLLDAAAAVPRESPAAPTAAFLQVRLLASAGRTDEARAVLASVPDAPEGAFSPSAVNLLRAQRFMLARSIEELTESLPRVPTRYIPVAFSPSPEPAFEPDNLDRGSIVDLDGMIVFSERLPLALLARAAQRPDTPPAVRYRLLAAAWSRAVLLGEMATAVAVAPALASLLPPLAGNLRAFVDAPDDAERRRRALLLHLRFPGLHAYVPGGRELTIRGETPVAAKLARFDHYMRDAWWCSFEDGDAGIRPTRRRYRAHEPQSAIADLLHGGEDPPSPAFLTAADREAASRELDRLARLGPAANHFAEQAVRWARAAPRDERAAEALARAVEGTRWACGNDATGRASRAAFQTLHKLFPGTGWARRTKYWYSAGF